MQTLKSLKMIILISKIKILNEYIDILNTSALLPYKIPHANIVIKNKNAFGNNSNKIIENTYKLKPCNT